MEKVVVERDVIATMRDGTRLFADIYRPETEGEYPVLLMRQPYDKTMAMTFAYSHPSWYARVGYIVVSQDVRGRWSSKGEFYPFRHEFEDGYDTVEWASRLPGSNGRVGMYGFSYGGLTQLFAAIARPPHLTCITPGFTGSQLFEGWSYNGGAFALAFNLSWTLYLAVDTAWRNGRSDLGQEIAEAFRNANARCFWRLPVCDPSIADLKDIAPYFFDWIDHPTYDDYWRQWSIEEQYDRIAVPGLHYGGWYDSFRDGVLKNFVGISRDGADEITRRSQKLVMGPWYHTPWASSFGALDFGENARNLIDDIQLKWFDYWLKGVENGIMDEPRVRFFSMGGNRWKEGSSWPPVRMKPVAYYLHSGGRANSLQGDGFLDGESPGDEPSDVYVYDPRSPSPSCGGQSCCIPDVAPMGPRDQRTVESSNQVLVFTSRTLPAGLDIAGPVTTDLFIASTALDTDFTAKLVDVHPDGRAINVTGGILRAKHRNSQELQELLEPDEIYRIQIRAGSTAHTFLPGHAMRLEVSSSDFPCWDRNTNTGNSPEKDNMTDIRVATNQVFHDGAHRSVLMLPVVE